MIRARMNDIRAKGRLRTLRAVHRISPRECEIDGRRLLDFSSNDYMGLSMRSELINVPPLRHRFRRIAPDLRHERRHARTGGKDRRVERL
mgnify:CR=1 FL=1